MKTKFEIFKELHDQKEVLVLPNAWDARSAAVLVAEKFPSVATSSAAVAHTLGYADGEGMPLQHYLFVIERILASVDVPLTVDFEMGYSTTDEGVYENVMKLIAMGVAGINIEDSIIKNRTRSPGDAKAFSRRVAFLRNSLDKDGLQLFLNIRCDTYLLNVDNKKEVTAARIAAYEAAGADAIFLPMIADPSDISAAVSCTKLPIGVMCIPGLPDFKTLTRLGVKRASMGPFLFSKVYGTMTTLVDDIRARNSYAPIL